MNPRLLATSALQVLRGLQWDGAGCRQGGRSPFCSAAAGAPVSVDAVVVGAGVIGLACARALALAGLETILAEQHPAYGTETSSRHSEVIHAGIYYPQGSLKAELCVKGKHLLYEYCSQKYIPHQRITKLIVATSAQQGPRLDDLQQKAAANGVGDLELLTGAEARDLEPALAACRALLSPSTGILDSHSYMASLLADAESVGAALAVNSQVLGCNPGPGQRHLVDIQDVGSGEVTRLSTTFLVNAAGLHAQAVSKTFSNLPPSSIPPQFLAKGHYFTLAGQSPFKRLIYPLPEDGGLGVHLTLDMGGQAKFGPDVKWVHSIDYSLETSRAGHFYPAIRSYYPALPDGSLSPSYTGIRPKVAGPGQPAADFMIQGEKAHGVKGLVCLYGMESPGLTSSLAVAEYVWQLLQGK